MHRDLRPLGVKVICSLLLAVSIVPIIGMAKDLVSHDDAVTTLALAGSSAVTGLGIMALGVTSFALWTARKWGRWLLTALCGVVCAAAILSFFFGGDAFDRNDLAYDLGQLVGLVAFLALPLLPAVYVWNNTQARYFFESMKTAQPGATDNPDDAYRLREDH